MITSQVFFALVEQHLTAAMLAAHYVKIGEYNEKRHSPTSELLSSGHVNLRRFRRLTWLQQRLSAPAIAALEVGYEGRSDGDEHWIQYYPESRELEVSSWRDTLDGHADWDVWHDRVVDDEAELERRLVVLGAAIRARSE